MSRLTRERDPSQTREDEKIYSPEELKQTNITKDYLINICQKRHIQIDTKNITKAQLIELILRDQGKSEPQGGIAMARPLRTFTITTGARPNPPSKDDSPEGLLIAERTRQITEWKRMVAKEQPWNNQERLQQIFNTKMRPLSPSFIIQGQQPTLVILVGPAASGKSSALERVGLGLTDDNTVKVDPDKIYEWLADKYGYFPPEIKIDDPEKKKAPRLKWWLENKDRFDELYGNTKEDGPPRRFEAAQYCTPKTHGVLGQYGAILPKMENMIFEGATNPGRLNVLLDTTGGMKEPFLERMANTFEVAGYKVVVVLVVSSVEDCKARVSGPGGRNAQQHRKLDEWTISLIWNTFVSEQTSCRWETFSRQPPGREFVVVQNTWVPETVPETVSETKSEMMEQGDEETSVSVPRLARIVYRRLPDGRISDESVTPEELASILGTYKVNINQDGTFSCPTQAPPKQAPGGGSSRRKRISRRRIHSSRRARKTIKKYYRPVTRRRRHRHS